ncbi:iron-containing alcohol dehydrogenase [bacterium]|nr:iron-containing alcohol dehydrogenase [bacterium]
MNNFEYYNPVNYIFGKDQWAKLSTLIPADAKVLMLYGGGSIMKNGVYDHVKKALENHEVLEFGGIEPNPQFSTLCRALEIIKEQKVDFLLAVGGGSVIDGTKFLSAATYYEGANPWEILKNRIRTEKGLPFGTVLTLPATGSEMNSGAVVSRAETGEKLTMGGPGLFPKFSICDPTVVHSIPKRQLANGVVDAFTHVMEQYMTYPSGALLQDRFAESILQTLIEVGPKVINQPDNYEMAANFMWSCTMALNGLIQKGVPTDWSVHMIAHELTAAYGIDHARTLAVILPSAYYYKFEQKKQKLAQYGKRVWHLSGDSDEVIAKEAIAKTKAFFESLGIECRLGHYTENYRGFAAKVGQSMINHGMLALGEHRDITPQDVERIVEMAY